MFCVWLRSRAASTCIIQNHEYFLSSLADCNAKSVFHIGNINQPYRSSMIIWNINWKLRNLKLKSRDVPHLIYKEEPVWREAMPILVIAQEEIFALHLVQIKTVSRHLQKQHGPQDHQGKYLPLEVLILTWCQVVELKRWNQNP